MLWEIWICGRPWTGGKSELMQAVGRLALGRTVVWPSTGTGWPSAPLTDGKRDMAVWQMKVVL